MEFDDKQLKLGHLLLVDRKCRVCGEEKNLVDGFYRTRKVEEQFHPLIHMNVRFAQLEE